MATVMHAPSLGAGQHGVEKMSLPSTPTPKRHPVSPLVGAGDSFASPATSVSSSIPAPMLGTHWYRAPSSAQASLVLQGDLEKRLSSVEEGLKASSLPAELEKRISGLEENLELLTVDVADTQARLEGVSMKEEQSRTSDETQGITVRLGRSVFDFQQGEQSTLTRNSSAATVETQNLINQGMNDARMEAKTLMNQGMERAVAQAESVARSAVHAVLDSHLAEHSGRLTSLEALVKHTGALMKDASKADGRAQIDELEKKALRSEVDEKLQHYVSILQASLDARVGDLQKRLDDYTQASFQRDATCRSISEVMTQMKEGQIGIEQRLIACESERANSRDLATRLESCQQSMQQYESDRKRILEEQQQLLKQCQDDRNQLMSLDESQRSADQKRQDLLVERVAEIQTRLELASAGMDEYTKRIAQVEAKIDSSNDVSEQKIQLGNLEARLEARVDEIQKKLDNSAAPEVSHPEEKLVERMSELESQLKGTKTVVEARVDEIQKQLDNSAAREASHPEEKLVERLSELESQLKGTKTVIEAQDMTRKVTELVERMAEQGVQLQDIQKRVEDADSSAQIGNLKTQQDNSDQSIRELTAESRTSKAEFSARLESLEKALEENSPALTGAGNAESAGTLPNHCIACTTLRDVTEIRADVQSLRIEHTTLEKQAIDSSAQIVNLKMQQDVLDQAFREHAAKVCAGAYGKPLAPESAVKEAPEISARLESFRVEQASVEKTLQAQLNDMQLQIEGMSACSADGSSQSESARMLKEVSEMRADLQCLKIEHASLEKLVQAIDSPAQITNLKMQQEALDQSMRELAAESKTRKSSTEISADLESFRVEQGTLKNTIQARLNDMQIQIDNKLHNGDKVTHPEGKLETRMSGVEEKVENMKAIESSAQIADLKMQQEALDQSFRELAIESRTFKAEIFSGLESLEKALQANKDVDSSAHVANLKVHLESSKDADSSAQIAALKMQQEDLDQSFRELAIESRTFKAQISSGLESLEKAIHANKDATDNSAGLENLRIEHATLEKKAMDCSAQLTSFKAQQEVLEGSFRELSTESRTLKTEFSSGLEKLEKALQARLNDMQMVTDLQGKLDIRMSGVEEKMETLKVADQSTVAAQNHQQEMLAADFQNLRSKFESFDQKVEKMSACAADGSSHGESARTLKEVSEIRADLQCLRIEHAALEKLVQAADPFAQIKTLQTHYEVLDQSFREHVAKLPAGAGDGEFARTLDVTEIRAEVQTLRMEHANLEKKADHSSLEQRLVDLEKLCGEYAEKHEENERANEIHKESMETRLKSIEQLTGDNADKHAKAIDEGCIADTKIDHSQTTRDHLSSEVERLCSSMQKMEDANHNYSRKLDDVEKRTRDVSETTSENRGLVQNIQEMMKLQTQYVQDVIARQKTMVDDITAMKNQACADAKTSLSRDVVEDMRTSLMKALQDDISNVRTEVTTQAAGQSTQIANISSHCDGMLKQHLAAVSSQAESRKVLEDAVGRMREDLENLKVEYSSLQSAIQAADRSADIASVESKYEALSKSLQDVAQLSEDADDRCRQAESASALSDDVWEIREDIAKLRSEHMSLERSIKDPMKDLLQDVVQLRGALLAVDKHSAEAQDAELIQKRFEDVVKSILRKEHSSFVTLAFEQHSEIEAKLTCLQTEFCALQEELRSKADISEMCSLQAEVRSKVDVTMAPVATSFQSSEHCPPSDTNGFHAEMGAMQMDLFHLGQRVQSQVASQVDSLRKEMERRLSAFPSDLALTHRLEAVERSLGKERRLIEDWVSPLVKDVPDLTRKLTQVHKQLQKEVSDAVKPFEEMLSQLVIGTMKMLQHVGFTSEDYCDNGGSWQDACADLPRMLDNAWLRLRQKKGTTVLKLLRQKADAEQVRDLQIKIDTLISCSSRSAWNDSPSRVPVPPPRATREEAYVRKPAPATPRRPASAGPGRRWASSTTPQSGVCVTEWSEWTAVPEQ